MTDRQTTFLHDFEGDVLVTYTWQGRPCWRARQIGERLGYSHEGKRLPNRILGEWGDEFVPGHDYALLTGDDLSAFNAQILASGLGHGRIGSNKLCLLFEPGVLLVLAKTHLPVGRRLRRFLVDEVLPQIARTGVYQAPPAAPASSGHVLMLFPDLQPRPSLSDRRETRLSEQVRVRERWIDYCDRRLAVFALHRLVDELCDVLNPATRRVIEVMAAERATGLPIADLLMTSDGDEPPPPAAANQPHAAAA
jgi:prophage antirepressor-like protein